MGRTQRKQKDTSVDLPECLLAHEHLLPALAVLLVFDTNTGFFTSYETHPLQFREKVATMQDAFSLDPHSPFALRQARVGRLGRCCRPLPRIGLRLQQMSILPCLGAIPLNVSDAPDENTTIALPIASLQSGGLAMTPA